MATGYTYCIEKGATFQEFAIGCAKAFGACISLRDEPQDSPIPEKFEPSNYHLNALKKAQEDLSIVGKMSLEEAGRLADDEYEKSLQSLKDGYKNNLELLDKYETMLNAAKRFVPPSNEHINFKEFMIKQLEESMNFDNNLEYYSREIESLVKETPEEYIRNRKNHLLNSIRYHTDEYAKEVKACEGRTKWITDLRGALLEL